MKLIKSHSRTWNVLEKRRFQNGCGRFWIFGWENSNLRHPKIDSTQCPIKSRICYVNSFSIYNIN